MKRLSRSIIKFSILALEKLPENWVLGQRLEVFIHTGSVENCLAIPNQFICRDKQRLFVLVDEQGRIAERDIKAGVQTRVQTQILSGLSESDRLILQPLQHREHVNRRIKK